MGGVKMKKTVLLLFILVLFLIGSSNAASAPALPMTEEEALTEAFLKTGAEAMESTISCWAKLNNRFMSMDRLGEELERVVEGLRLQKVQILKNTESDDQLNKIVLYGTKDSKAYSISLESINNEKGGETYLVIDVSMDKNCKALKEEKDSIAEVIPKDAVNVNYSSCIIGTYKGKLSKEEVEAKTERALQAINAKKVEGMRNDDMLSISAFSSSVESFVLSRQQRINIQVAVRFSTYENMTYIWIGTPLIPVEY